MKWFQKKKRIKLGCVAEVSCEDENTLYFTFPDGLRLIIRNGEYDGWYVCKEEDNESST
jgi:hypothetical protein